MDKSINIYNEISTSFKNKIFFNKDYGLKL